MTKIMGRCNGRTHYQNGWRGYPCCERYGEMYGPEEIDLDSANQYLEEFLQLESFVKEKIPDRYDFYLKELAQYKKTIADHLESGEIKSE